MDSEARTEDFNSIKCLQPVTGRTQQFTQADLDGHSHRLTT
jgi:hypothetical protein